MSGNRTAQMILARVSVICVVGFLMAAAAVVALRPLSTEPSAVLYGTRTFRGDYFNQPDVTLNAWILAWTTRALQEGNVEGFYRANALYPEVNALAYSEHLLGATPLFAPFYLSTHDLAFSYNMWILSTFVLSGLAMFWVVARCLGSYAAASVASIVYAFAPWRFYELAHTQVLSVQYLPLLAYATWRAGAERSRALWLAIAGLALLQTLSSYYLGYLAFCMAGLCALLSSFLRAKKPLGHVLFSWSALLFAAACLVPLSIPYLHAAGQGGFWHHIATRSPWTILTTYLFPVFSKSADQTWSVYYMVPWLACGGFIVAIFNRSYRSIAIVAASILIVGAWLALGPAAELLGVPIGYVYTIAKGVVPGWSSLRVYARFGILVWLAISFLAAIPFARGLTDSVVFARLQSLAAAGVAIAVLASAFALHLEVVAAPNRSRDTAAYEFLATNGDRHPVLEWPMAWGRPDSEYMFLSTIHWAPLLNGYTGYVPPSRELIQSLADALPRQAALDTLTDLNLARWILVHIDDPGAQPKNWDALKGATLRYADDTARVYELAFDRDVRAHSVDFENSSLLGTPKVVVEESDLEATLVPTPARIVNRNGLRTHVRVRVTNKSRRSWPSVGYQPNGLVGLVFQITRVDDEQFWKTTRFIRLPSDLAPGETVVANASLRAPGPPGVYELLPCLVQWDHWVEVCFEQSRIELDYLPDARGAAIGHPTSQ